MPNPNTGPFSPITPFAAGGAAAGLIPVSTVTLASPAATLDITGLDSSSRLWKLVLTLLQPVNNGADPELLMELGGSFEVANYQWLVEKLRTSSTTFLMNSVVTSNFISLGGASSWTNAAGRAGQMVISIYNPAQTSDRKAIEWSGGFFNTGPAWQGAIGTGAHKNITTAFTALRLRMSAGNIAAGLIADLYKLDTP